MSGLTLLLPHGFEGQGPVHSSARLERYLQLCAERNMTVGNLTTPASYFHALRRQMKRNFRKPLVLMTPKSLLRHKLAVSPVSEFTGNSRFRTVIGEIDAIEKPAEVKRVVLCSGKVYYDLLQERRDQGIRDVAIFRLEQLYPFPEKSLAFALKPYSKAQIVWCQEEPGEYGSVEFCRPADRTRADRAETPRKAAELCRAQGRRQPRDRSGQGACRRAGSLVREALTVA